MIRSTVVFACFFVSGACGLIYETVWLKQFSYVFGNTVIASTLVLSAFMGGLALGSHVIGRLSDRLHRTLWVYGALEVAAAAATLAIPPVMAIVKRIHLELLAPLDPPAGLVCTFQFAAGFGVLLVPTLLMGGTLPLLSRSLPSDPAGAGRVVGLLYAANNAGAVVGALACGFVLVLRFGLAGSALLAQVANVAAGTLAIVADRWSAPAVVERPARVRRHEERARREAGRARGRAAPLLVYVFLTGFAAMVFEVALMRVLPLILGSSIHSFSLMVATFIAGLALGSLAAAAVLPRVREVEVFLGTVQIGIGMAALAAIPLINHLPGIYLRLRTELVVPFAVFQVVCLAICALVMLPPACLLGLVLPAATEEIARRGRAIGATTGSAYAANTLGNIMGTLSAGLALVPGFGFKRTMEVGCAICLVAGLALALRRSASFVLSAGAVAGVAASVTAYAALYPGLDVLALTAQVFRPPEGAKLDGGPISERLRADREVLYYEEDSGAIVTVDRWLRARTRSLRVNGKVEASTSLDMRTQKLVAHFPLVLHREPRSALLIGFGSGITAFAALQHPLTRLTCVEISPAVVRASRYFVVENGRCLADPRLALVVDDGRSFLERSRSCYDVIISEPSNPWLAGLSNLYTREFFRTAARRLTANGLMCQWVQAYDMDMPTFQLILRTFREAFRHAFLFRVSKVDMLLIGSSSPVPADWDAIIPRLTAASVREDLASVDVTQPMLFVGHHLVADEDLPLLAGSGPINTDDHPLLEYLAPMQMYAGKPVEISEPLFRVRSEHSWIRKYVRSRPIPASEIAAFCRYFRDEYHPDILLTLLEEVVAMDPGNVAARGLLADTLDRKGERLAALGQVREAARRSPRTPGIEALRYRVAFALENRRLSLTSPASFPVSLDAARSLVALAPDVPEHRADLGAVQYSLGDWKEADVSYGRAIELSGQRGQGGFHALAYYLLMRADCRLKLGELDEAARLLARSRAAGPALSREHEELSRLVASELELARARSSRPGR
jgi:predicted membrane-bound spermidine synthase/tetratricopeptide (TPR) repeat protein